MGAECHTDNWWLVKGRERLAISKEAVQNLDIT